MKGTTAPVGKTAPTSAGVAGAAPGSNAGRPAPRTATASKAGGSAPASASQAPARPSTRSTSSRGGSAVDNGAGLILGYLFYVLIVLPAVRGGPARVKDNLRAKFFNKDAQGKWLP